MTPATLAIFFVSLVIIGTATDVAPATKQPIEFFPSLQEHDKSLFVTVEGCNKHCLTACFDCNIEKQPPVCVQCCPI
ncbi:hypothetical protein ARALYDRAFT_322865 [Arabidopsis lyrata subsp. lyrata]|uniref:Embryo surrounding factor 1 brassicaceae domain-containing protein n=1 Tax=Arabidopsis lyrata subsp. lyrata TaxID=81972 RepID=D7LPF7_ARALL|nr:hypothetical protein ARALYDRAFT_322865 [Arabidopsis lyrata subsp. lyrata]